MQVLMRVEVRDPEAGALCPRDLCLPFALHLGAPNSAGRQGQENTGPVRAERDAGKERRDVARRGDRSLAARDAEVDARLENPRLAQAYRGLVEGGAVREKAHVCEEPVRAERGDTARVRGSEAEVVGVEDDARQGVPRRRRSARISGA